MIDIKEIEDKYDMSDPDEVIIFNNKDLTMLKPNKRREEGISFIPEERIGHATVSSFNLSDNF